MLYVTFRPATDRERAMRADFPGAWMTRPTIPVIQQRMPTDPRIFHRFIFPEGHQGTTGFWIPASRCRLVDPTP